MVAVGFMSSKTKETSCGGLGRNGCGRLLPHAPASPVRHGQVPRVRVPVIASSLAGPRRPRNRRRPGRWREAGGRPAPRGYAGAVPAAVIVSAVRTPFGRLGGGLADRSAVELGGDRDPRGARARRRRAGGRRLRRDGTGAAGGRRPGAGAAGGDRGGDPEGGSRRHDQQGLRVVDPRGRDRRADDRRGPPRRRRRPVGWSRCRRRRTCCRRRASATAWATARCSTTRSSTGSPRRSTGCTWSSRRLRSRASSGSAGRSRTRGRSARTSARPRRRTPAASTTRSSPSATSPPTRACAATRRSRSSRR